MRVSWWRPPIPPSAFATTQRTSETQIQVVPMPKPQVCQSQIPKTSVPATPMPMIGSVMRDEPQEERGLARPLRR